MLDNFNRLVLANLHTLGAGLSVTAYVCFFSFLLAVVLGALAVCSIALGATTGRGRNGPGRAPHGPLKEVYLHPLGVDFRRRLCT